MVSLSLSSFQISPMFKSLDRRSTFEDLSDDILMDIFDLLNPPIYIYHSFYNLNARLNRILRDARLLMSLDLSRMFNPANFAFHCQIMLPNMFKQLISFRLSNRIQLYEQIRIFLQHFHFSQFESLRQLSLVQITFEQLKTSLSDILSLKKLIQLEIDAFDGSGVSSDELQRIANTLISRSSSIKVKSKPIPSLCHRIDSFSVSASSIQSRIRHSRKPFAIAAAFEFGRVLFIGCSTIVVPLYKSSIFNGESRTNASSLFDRRISGSRWNDSTSTSLIDLLPSIEKILSRYQRSNVGRCQVVSLPSGPTSLLISSRPFGWRRLFQRRTMKWKSGKNFPSRPWQSGWAIEWKRRRSWANSSVRSAHRSVRHIRSGHNDGRCNRITNVDRIIGICLFTAERSTQIFSLLFSHLFPTSLFSRCIQKGSATFSSFIFQIWQSEKNMSSAPLGSIDGRILGNPSISFAFQRPPTRKDLSRLPIRISRLDSPHLQSWKGRTCRSLLLFLLHRIIAKKNQHSLFLFSRRWSWRTVLTCCSCSWSTGEDDWGWEVRDALLCFPFHPTSPLVLMAHTHLIGQPICARSSLFLLIVPMDGNENENENGRRCLYLSDAIEGNHCRRNVDSCSSAWFARWNSSADFQGIADGGCSVLSCRCSSTTEWPRPWFSLHSSPWSEWFLGNEIPLHRSVPNSWRSAVTPVCQDSPASSLPCPSHDCGIGFSQRDHRCWHLSSAVLHVTSTFQREISSLLFDRYRRWSSPLPVKRKLSSLSFPLLQMIWSSVPCANKSHIFVLTWNLSKISKKDSTRRHLLWFCPHVQNYSNWNSFNTSRNFLG